MGIRGLAVSLLCAWCAYGQPSSCQLSGQAGGLPFDAKSIDWTGGPAANQGGFTANLIGRVVGLNPLTIEVLDSDRTDQGGDGLFAFKEIHSVDARLRDAVTQLRFGEAIVATFTLESGSRDALVLTAIEKIEGPPVYFHESRRNRSGMLVARQANGEVLVVYRDGSVDYRDIHSLIFDRLRLSPRDVASLLESFGRAAFDRLPGKPPADDGDSIRLLCSRYQQVSVPGRQAALAGVLTRLREVRARAVTATPLMLSYEERRKIVFSSWPFPELPITIAGARIRAASDEEFQARCSLRPARGDYRMYHKELPAAFLDRLPIIPAGGAGLPLYDGYFRAGTAIYRVSRAACDGEPADCRTFYQVHVEQVKLPAIAPAEPGCSRLAALAAVLWPADAGIRLANVSPIGQAIADGEYAAHDAFYRELLAAQNCGGVNFIEDGYWYRGVKAAPVPEH